MIEKVTIMTDDNIIIRIIFSHQFLHYKKI